MRRKDPLQALAGNTGSGTMRNLMGLAITIALLAIVVKFPSDAAHWAKELWGFIRQAF